MSEDIFQIVLDQSDRLFVNAINRDLHHASERGEWPEELWSKAAEAGLPLAMASEKCGGVGLSWAETAMLIRRMGYHAVPLPLPEAILANALWSEAAGELLEGPCTLAPVSPGDRVVLKKKDRAYSLGGAAKYVPWYAPSAEMIVHAYDDSGHEYLARLHKDRSAASRRNIAGEPRENVDMARRELAASDVRRLARPFGPMGLLPFVAALRTQQIIGAMERCLDYALAYANERVQFGRPIAKFQAIQHMLAIAAGQLAAATAAADALSSLPTPNDDLFVVAAAKARCSEAVGPVAAITHQLHGAMGFTHEHPLHFSTRRLWSWRDEGGSETYWQEWIGRLICTRGSETFWPLIVNPHMHAADTPPDRAVV